MIQEPPAPAKLERMTAIRVMKGDITTLAVDVIVNAANGSLLRGGGVDGAIHRAGGPWIADEARRIIAERGPLRAGEAAMTGGGDLPARFIIHAVGPVWGSQPDEESHALLADCYRTSLDLALSAGCTTIAFPNISTGAFGFPAHRAAGVAVAAVSDWANENPDVMEEITFVCFTESNHGLYQELLP